MTPRHVRRAAAALLILAAALTTISCSLFGGNDDVVLFGDSLTMLTSKQVTKDARSDYHVTTSANWGLRIDEELDAATEVSAQDPEQVIINLGTNNILQGHDATATAQDLNTILDQLSDIKCIHLVTINEQMSRLGENYSAGAKVVNEEIRTIARRRLNVDVIDWNKIVLDHEGEDIMSSDTVHPNTAGVKLLSKAYLKALDSC